MYVRFVHDVSDMLQEAAQAHGSAGLRITGGDQPAQPDGTQNEEATGPAADGPLQSEAEEDMETEGPAQATRRRPVDPVLPNKRRSYIKQKMGVFKSKVGYIWRVYFHVIMECHVKLWTFLVTAPQPLQVNSALSVARHAWHDLTDMCVCSSKTCTLLVAAWQHIKSSLQPKSALMDERMWRW